MTVPYQKKRLANCKGKTMRILECNFNSVIQLKHSIFDFIAFDRNGIRLTKVELDSLAPEMEREILSFKEKVPSNTILEVLIYEKHEREPKRRTF